MKKNEVEIEIEVVMKDGKVHIMPKIGRAWISRGENEVVVQMRKVTRGRFIRVAMALGWPARIARGMAKTVRELGFCYTKGMIYLIGFTKRNPPNIQAKLWSETWEELLDTQA